MLHFFHSDHVWRQIIPARPHDWARHRPPALSQEWCKKVGVIADEAGVAVEAIKAWGKELMGWWREWGFDLSIKKWGC